MKNKFKTLAMMLLICIIQFGLISAKTEDCIARTQSPDLISINETIPVPRKTAGNATTWGVIGEINGWYDDLPMTQISDTQYTITIESLYGEFKFRKDYSWDENIGIPFDAYNGIIKTKSVFPMERSGANLNMGSKAQKVTLNLNFETETIEVLVHSPQSESSLSIKDVNKDWGVNKNNVIKNQPSNYKLIQDNPTDVIYSAMVDDMEVYVSYKFGDNQKLCASTLSMPFNDRTRKFADELFSNYDDEMEIIEGVEVKRIGEEIITIDNSTAFNNALVLTIGFSYYEPIEERDDCVDLGLSVRWSNCNLGATSPIGVGDFYAWSETDTKSEYWRENYSFCNNNANQYIFVYTNPYADICGTSYDVATKKLGEGWRMPSLAEANELITQCDWEREVIDGTAVYRVTGPNGNSIILPVISKKRQNKEHTTSLLQLATGECPSKSSEDFYVITTESKYGPGSISSEWKAWGYNIRPVFTK